MNQWKDRFEFQTLYSVARLLQKLPPETVVKLSRALGSFVYYVIPIRKNVVLQNLELAFPETTQRERKRIARNTYKTFGQTFFEFMRTPARTRQELQRRIRLHNTHLLQESYKAGHGTLLMTGHFGNWEIAACAIVDLGYPLVVIARRQRNRLVDELINHYRRIAGIETVPLGMGVREFLRALRQNKFVAMLADQDAHREGVFVQFFNRLSATAPGPALFAIKTGAPIIFTTCVLNRDDTYDITFERIDISDSIAKGNEAIREITQRHVSHLEEKIRQWPHHWFWMHRRWKTPPPTDEKVPHD